MASDIALLFSAQGGQWPGMGAALFKENGRFQQALLDCDEVIRELLGWSIVEEVTRDVHEWRMHRAPELVQPGLTSVQIALARVFEASGVRPLAVVGLSMGEAAASYAAGALTMRDALHIVATQARLTRHALRPGRMIMAFATASAVRPAIDGEPDVSIAVELAPSITVLSGEANAVARAAGHLARSGVQMTDVPIGFAFHSNELAPLHDEFVGALCDLQPVAENVPLYSAACGGPVSGPALHALHWWSIMSRGARFVAVVDAALKAGCRTFVEVGPHPTLQDAVCATAREAGIQVTYLPAMLRGECSSASLTAALARCVGEEHWV